jgi:hypothetical protein
MMFTVLEHDDATLLGLAESLLGAIGIADREIDSWSDPELPWGPNPSACRRTLTVVEHYDGPSTYFQPPMPCLALTLWEWGKDDIGSAYGSVLIVAWPVEP